MSSILRYIEKGDARGRRRKSHKNTMREREVTKRGWRGQERKKDEEGDREMTNVWLRVREDSSWITTRAT